MLAKAHRQTTTTLKTQHMIHSHTVLSLYLFNILPRINVYFNFEITQRCAGQTSLDKNCYEYNDHCGVDNEISVVHYVLKIYIVFLAYCQNHQERHWIERRQQAL